MKNVIMFVIDSLSYWYIQEYMKVKKENFFNELAKKTFNATQMYTTGPFTEAALMGLLASQYPLDNQGYQVLLHDSNKTLLKVFRENGYKVYMGGQVPPLCDAEADSWNYRDLKGERYESLVEWVFWKDRFTLFFDWYDKGVIKKQEIDLLADIMSFLFEYYQDDNDSERQREYRLFMQDKRKYANAFLAQKKEHPFYKKVLKTYRIEWEMRETTQMTDRFAGELPDCQEARLLCEIGLRNQKKYIDLNRSLCEKDEECKQILERDLAGWSNKDIQSNNNLIRQFRGLCFEPSCPTIGGEAELLLDWMDKQEGNKPFFAYLHVLDFHFRQSVTENDAREYGEKLNEIEEALRAMPDVKMSFSKALSLMHIEKELKKFWEALEKRGFFKDSYLIITADHGITNFMYPISAAKWERWVYNKVLFNVPFYMAGGEITPETRDDILENLDVPVTLLKLLEMPVPKKYKGKDIFAGKDIHEFSHTEWINHCPNVIRRPIKFGIRDKRYSITFVATLNEFVDSGECVAIFDYEQDPDGTVNLAFKDSKAEILQQYFPKIRQRWYELLLHYYLDYEERYFEKNRTFRMLKENPEQIKKWSEEQSCFSWEKFCENAAGKKIILFGTSEYAKECLGKIGLFIYEIWDNDGGKNDTCFMGHLVKNPHELVGNVNDYIFVIADPHEIEIRIQLDDMKIQNVYIGRQLIRSKERGDFHL